MINASMDLEGKNYHPAVNKSYPIQKDLEKLLSISQKCLHYDKKERDRTDFRECKQDSSKG